MAAKRSPIDRVMTAQEVADLHGVTRRRVVQLCEAGVLRARLAAGAWIIDRTSAEAWTPPPKGRPPKPTT